MIDPFFASQVASGKISYGLSSYGYDLRLADEFRIFTPPLSGIIDPKAIPPKCYREYRGPHCDIPPHTYVLGRTVEYLRIPRNVLTLCLGKSTYARAGVLVNVTPFEPEWEGYPTISIANTTPVQSGSTRMKDCARSCFFSRMNRAKPRIRIERANTSRRRRSNSPRLIPGLNGNDQARYDFHRQTDAGLSGADFNIPSIPSSPW